MQRRVPHISASETAANLARQIFLEAPEFGHSLLSKSPLVYSERGGILRGDDGFSRQLARSVWKFQRQQQSFRRIGISRKSEEGLLPIKVRPFLFQLQAILTMIWLQNGFDPMTWQDASTTRFTTFMYFLCNLGEMSDCLLWTIWQSMQGELRVPVHKSPHKSPHKS